MSRFYNKIGIFCKKNFLNLKLARSSVSLEVSVATLITPKPHLSLVGTAKKTKVFPDGCGLMEVFLKRAQRKNKA